MAEYFTGICIGGPMAGQMVAKEGPSFSISVFEAYPDLHLTASADTEHVIKPDMYYYSYQPMTKSVNFWIYHNLRYHNVIELLAEAYVAQQYKEDSP